MQVDRLSISLPLSLLTFLADYQQTHAVSSPSEVITKALELLREQELANLTQAKEASDGAQSITSMGGSAAPTQPTVLQRMGGLPQDLLSVGGLSDRETRRAVITARIQARHQARQEPGF
ncbi:hypothetical protein [Leptolyngbya sp. PCC 6406]|uniref:hypothetical protein n=1 Tax=Leptolyngbya sp. PCC 6406 TaxID=1173264 RepID=UPI00055F60CA|nr:hypothetical protein [Leptolyngbya sp. PCC 6406]